MSETHRDGPPLPPDLAEAAERLVQSRLASVRLEETLAIYQDLIDSIWNRLELPLGRMTVHVLFERALSETVEHHPELTDAMLTPIGLSLSPLQSSPWDSDPERFAGQDLDEEYAERTGRLREGLREFIVRLIEILVLLTGDILVRRILPDLEVTHP